jgi:hypothetical protein
VNVLITRYQNPKLQLSCLRLLKRFYEIFARHQRVLEDTILTCLQNFALLPEVKKHKPAALFYYHLLHSFETNPEFKRKLQEDKMLEILRYNPHFSGIFWLQQVEQEQGEQELADLHLRSGFPLAQAVEAKHNFVQYVTARHPHSVLHYNFTTAEYNIGFSVERVGQLKLGANAQGWEEVNNEEIVRYSICDSHLKPISVIIFIHNHLLPN